MPPGAGPELDQAAPCRRWVEWHQGELYPRVGFLVTDLKRPAERVVRFYNGRHAAPERPKTRPWSMNPVGPSPPEAVVGQGSGLTGHRRGRILRPVAEAMWESRLMSLALERRM